MIFDLSKSYSVEDIGNQCPLCDNLYTYSGSKFSGDSWFDCLSCNYYCLLINIYTGKRLSICMGIGGFSFPAEKCRYRLCVDNFGMKLYDWHNCINTLNTSPTVDIKHMKEIAERYSVIV